MKRNWFAILLALLSFMAGAFTLPHLRLTTGPTDSQRSGLAAKPQLATRTQYFSGAEQDALDRQLSSAVALRNTYGLSAAQATAKLAQSGLTELQRFPVAALSPQQRTSAAIISWTLQNAIQRTEFAQNRFVFEQFDGLHLALVEFMTTTHPIRTNAMRVK